MYQMLSNVAFLSAPLLGTPLYQYGAGKLTYDVDWTQCNSNLPERIRPVLFLRFSTIDRSVYLIHLMTATTVCIAHRNAIFWSPHGRFLCIAGFGNLAGEMDFYDTLRSKKIGES